MSTGVKRVAAPQVPEGVGLVKKPGTNGSGLVPLTYSSGEPADDVNMNEVDDKVVLQVCLPSGNTSSVTVDSNIPMLDLLVHLAARCKISPSGHSLQVLDEETGKNIDFKANQTIGSLGCTTVYIVSKNKKPEWSQTGKTNSTALVFERTNRFTVNLPGGQKTVMRISPQLTLEQVFARVCKDKSLDSNRYTLQHPHQPMAPLDLKATIAECKLSEINLIQAAVCTAGDISRSMPDLYGGRKATSTQDLPSGFVSSTGQTKKKKGFLSFLSKKDKKAKHDSHSVVEPNDSSKSQQRTAPVPQPRSSTPPPDRRGSDSHRPPRPKTMFETAPPSSVSSSVIVTDNGHIPTAPARTAGKKRPAPRPPPTQAATPAASSAPSATGTHLQAATPPPRPPSAQVTSPAASSTPVASGIHGQAASGPPEAPYAVSVTAGAPAASSRHPQPASRAPAVSNVTIKSGTVGEAEGVSRLHSRNSSDSSGYHELTLSGAESPEASRVPTAFKTSIDTTSIESSDNPSGDGATREMLPGSESSRLGIPVDAQDKGDKCLTLPSTKKKKAPVPPQQKAKPEPVKEETNEVDAGEHTADLSSGKMSASIAEAENPPPPLTVEMNLTDSADVHDFQEKSPDEPAGDEMSESGEPFHLNDILDAIKFDEEPLRYTASRDQDDVAEEKEETEMAMMETASIISEDAEVIDVKSRPCEFIPPPPPLEPPPDYPPDWEETLRVDKGTVVGEDNISLAPASLKSSPVATHRRSESRASLASLESVDSIQSLSLAFEQTIAAGQEALNSELWLEEDGPEYKTEMARFVAEMSRLTTDNPVDNVDVTSNDTSMSQPETESASDTGSVIYHEVPGHVREDSKESQFSLSSMGFSKDSVSGFHTNDSRPSNAFAMTEEIHAPVETVPPPLEFQTELNHEEEEEEDDDEEEEEVITVTEEYIVPVGPAGLDYAAAVKVSAQERRSSIPKSKNSSSTIYRAEPVTLQEKHQNAEKMKKPATPAPKEEFVLTVEDLSNVSLLPLRPKLYTEPKPMPTPSPLLYTQPKPTLSYSHAEINGEQKSDAHDVTEVYGSPERPHVHLAYVSSHGHIHLAGADETSADITHRAQRDSVHRHLTEPLSKPSAMLHLPSMRVSGSTEPTTFSDDDRSSESSIDHLYRSTAKLTIGNKTPEDASDDNSGRLSGDDSRRTSISSSTSQTQELLQQQYSGLQDQFALWQRQLQQNQALLTAHSAGAGEGSDSTLQTLQMQIQMQQQMMQQLQMSMEALSAQQRQQTETQRYSPSPPAHIAAPPPPPPAPAHVPAAPSVPTPASRAGKTSMTMVKTRPVSSRFEPQLDPREELMIAIRSFGGRAGLNAVPLKSTKWIHSGK